MTRLPLPAAVAAYFAADQQNDSAAVARCFSIDGVVVDEAQVHLGPADIARWKADASARYRYRCEPQRVDSADNRHVVTGRLSGDFPGSPIDLRYDFVVNGDEITRLEIGVTTVPTR